MAGRKSSVCKISLAREQTGIAFLQLVLKKLEVVANVYNSRGGGQRQVISERTH